MAADVPGPDRVVRDEGTGVERGHLLHGGHLMDLLDGLGGQAFDPPETLTIVYGAVVEAGKCVDRPGAHTLASLRDLPTPVGVRAGAGGHRTAARLGGRLR